MILRLGSIISQRVHSNPPRPAHTGDYPRYADYAIVLIGICRNHRYQERPAWRMGSKPLSSVARIAGCISFGELFHHCIRCRFPGRCEESH